MKLRTLVTVGLLSASPSLLLAQSQVGPLPAVAPQAPPAPTAAGVPRTGVAPAPAMAEAPQAPPTPKAAPAIAPAPPRPVGQMVNVRIDVTLSDSKGAPKTLTMTVADGESAMNRTTAAAIPTGQAAYVDYSFNADASPTIVGNRIRLRLTADAVVLIEGEKPPATGPGPKLALRQSQVLVLNDGDAVEIARSADPVSDRVFTLSVKATIQR